MMFQVIAFLPLLGLALSAALPATQNSLCHGLDCPQFTELLNTTDYELRHYNESKWVSVRKEGALLDDVHRGLFMTLFHYIDGHNANNEKIAMTTPVVTKVAHGQGPNCASNFTMHFMLPHDHWATPVAPTDSNVKIVTMPAMDVYVKSFPGWARDEEYTSTVMAFYQTLQDKNMHQQVDTAAFFTAGYDGPYEFAHRHNEVWIRKLDN